MNNQLLAERITHRVLGCGMGLGEAARDVFQWFGVQLSAEDKIDITCRAGRLITADIQDSL